MSDIEQQLRNDLKSYHISKAKYLNTPQGRQLQKKLHKEIQKQTRNGSSCCWPRLSRRSGPTAEVKHERVKIRYYQNKLAEQIKLSCSDELRQLKETTKHCREQSVLDRKNQHLQQAHRILYVDHFREKLLDAIKQKQSDKLESIISKTYQRSPLAKELHQELATAEKVLAYVKKRDHVQRGSTWKFEYEPDQAGYNLSYWVGSDQHWLRNRYWKTQRRQVEPDFSGAFEQSLARSNSSTHSCTSEAPNESGKQIHNEQDAISENTPAEFADIHEEKDNYTDKVRERLHNAVRSESIDANEIREALAEFQELKLEEKDGDFARGCMLLEVIGLRQALRKALDDEDKEQVRTCISDIEVAELRSELFDIVAEAEEFLLRMESPRKKKNLEFVLRKKLRLSMQSRMIDKIKAALQDVLRNDLEEQLHVDVAAARALISQLEREAEEPEPPAPIREEERYATEIFNLKQMLRHTMVSPAISRLEAAIKSVIETSLSKYLEKELKEAHAVLEKLKEKLAFRKSVAEIPARYVSEVRSYVNPPSGVLEVMQATFLLLGFPESNLKTWKDVQSHLGKTGTDSFRYRVVKRDDSAVDAALIAHARNILNTVPLESAENLSLLVNVFYRYCQATIEESSLPNEVI